MKKSSYKGDILALLCFIMSLVRLTDKEFSFAIDTTVAPLSLFMAKRKDLSSIGEREDIHLLIIGLFNVIAIFLYDEHCTLKSIDHQGCMRNL